MFEHLPNHYLGHIYTAMRDWMYRNSKYEGTPIYSQMQDIKDTALAEWHARKRVEEAKALKEWSEQNEAKL